MMKSVEVTCANDPDECSKEDMQTIARTHGFPLTLSSLVQDKFDDLAHVFMTEHFKSAIPVS